MSVQLKKTIRKLSTAIMLSRENEIAHKNCKPVFNYFRKKSKICSK